MLIWSALVLQCRVCMSCSEGRTEHFFLGICFHIAASDHFYDSCRQRPAHSQQLGYFIWTGPGSKRIRSAQRRRSARVSSVPKKKKKKITSHQCGKVIQGNGNQPPYLFGFMKSLPACLYSTYLPLGVTNVTPNPPPLQTSCVSSSSIHSLELIDCDNTPAALDMAPNPRAIVALFMRRAPNFPFQY